MYCSMGRVLNCVVVCVESIELGSGLWGECLHIVLVCGESIELCSGLWGECRTV